MMDHHRRHHVRLILLLCLVPCLALGQQSTLAETTPSISDNLSASSQQSQSDSKSSDSELLKKGAEIEGYPNYLQKLSLPQHLKPENQKTKLESQVELGQLGPNESTKVHRFSSGLLRKSPVAAAIISAANKLGHGQRLKRGIFSTLTGLGNVGSFLGGGSGGASGGHNNGNSLMTSGAVNLINSVTGGNNKDPDDDDSSPMSSSSSSSSSLSSSSSSTASSLLSAMTAPGKPKPYHFNDVELSAIQAVVALRDVLGDILHRVGFNIPTSLSSLITRSEGGDSKVSSNTPSTNDQPPVYYTSNGLPSFNSAGSALSSLAGLKASGNVGLLLRGLALSLPLLIPMATQIRRMSSESSALASSAASALLPSASQFQNFPASTFQTLQSLPFDPYYNQALHRRRGKRSVNSAADETQPQQSPLATTTPTLPKNKLTMTVPLFHQLHQQAHQRMAAEQIIRVLQELEEKYGELRTSNRNN